MTRAIDILKAAALDPELTPDPNDVPESLHSLVRDLARADTGLVSCSPNGLAPFIRTLLTAGFVAETRRTEAGDPEFHLTDEGKRFAAKIGGPTVFDRKAFNRMIVEAAKRRQA